MLYGSRKRKCTHIAPEEYFIWEEQQTEKYEYINGEVYATGGGSINHGRIAIRFTAMLDAHLEGRNCLAGNSDIKVNIAGTSSYVYPDASVTCNESDRSNKNYFTYPCLIVEVLSKSTEAYDRGNKFRLYSKNPILQDYLLVSSTSVEIDLYHKNDAGEWVIANYQAGDAIELRSIGLRFPIEPVYRGLELGPE